VAPLRSWGASRMSLPVSSPQARIRGRKLTLPLRLDRVGEREEDQSHRRACLQRPGRARGVRRRMTPLRHRVSSQRAENSLSSSITLLAANTTGVADFTKWAPLASIVPWAARVAAFAS
jgi:hypothetical protein